MKEDTRGRRGGGGKTLSHKNKVRDNFFVRLILDWDLFSAARSAVVRSSFLWIREGGKKMRGSVRIFVVVSMSQKVEIG